MFARLGADWDQISSGLGMQRPNQDNFCFLCQCCKPDRYKFDDADSWIPRTTASYLADVDRSQIKVELGMSDLLVLFANFVLDARDNGVHGRALSKDLQLHDCGTGALVQLQKWDRLEVGGHVTDIHTSPGELVGDGPWHVVLWRRIPGVHFNFFPSIMQVPGMQYEYIMLDTLHFLDLGVSQRLIGHVVVSVLKDGAKFGNDCTEAAPNHKPSATTTTTTTTRIITPTTTTKRPCVSAGWCQEGDARPEPGAPPVVQQPAATAALQAQAKHQHSRQGYLENAEFHCHVQNRAFQGQGLRVQTLAAIHARALAASRCCITGA